MEGRRKNNEPAYGGATDDSLLEPIKAYSGLRIAFEQNVNSRLDELIKLSGIDTAANEATVKRLHHEEKTAAAAQGRVASQKAWRAVLIVLAVLGFISAIVGAVGLCMSYVLPYAALLPIGLIFGIVGIVVPIKVLSPRIKADAEIAEKHAEAAKVLKDEAWGQTAPLNALFESDETKKLVEKTLKGIVLDDDFSMHRYDCLHGKYGFDENHDETVSTTDIVSGEISGNPYVADRRLAREIVPHTYTGSIVITWTTVERDSEGRSHTVHHSQTLVASIVRPKPEYVLSTRLIYANEAAPDLNFTRDPKHVERMSERAYKKAVKSGAKKIRKKQEKAIESGASNFTEMGNTEFDALFGALDRDNEVQFRLLFTPLAQRNMLELMRGSVGYGDDFRFYKAGRLNYIYPEHAEAWDLDTSYTRYASYDVNLIRQNFATINTEFFKHLYFALAPVLGIPLYLQHKPAEYIYGDDYERNYTDYEAECAVNRMGASEFAHAETATDVILKTRLIAKHGRSDELEVTAHSFRAVPRVELVPRFGGDGETHLVPVPWIEYVPIFRKSTVMLKRIGLDDKRYKALQDRRGGDLFSGFSGYGGKSALMHGLLCCMIKDRTEDEVFEGHSDPETFDAFADEVFSEVSDNT